MGANYLEQLLAEWYEYKGYFVRRNIHVGRRAAGGYECELDIVAFHPQTKHLLHLEPSMDTDSWAQRERRYSKKFLAGQRYIPELFKGVDGIPMHIDQRAIFVYASTKNVKLVGGQKVVSFGDVLKEIFSDIKSKSLLVDAIPQHLAILRSFQFVTHYKTIVFGALSGDLSPS